MPRLTPRRPPRTTIAVDGLGLHRLGRQALRDLHERIEQLEALVALLHTLSVDVYAGDQPDHLRANATTMKATLRAITSTAVDAAVAVGQVRFVGQLRGVELDRVD